ncbi:MAG: glycosyltransferase family 4 protein [bacterium]|nr:glycosyltransferase family 4 protein [bacterium]
MKICFVSDTVDYSWGGGRFAYSMIKTLKDNFGIQSIILIYRGEKKLLKEAKPILFRHSIIGRFIINPLIIAWYSRNADLIHAFDGWPLTVEVYLATRLNGKRYSNSLYATYAVAPLYRKSQRSLMKLAYDHCSLNSPISHLTEERLKEAYPKIKTEVINQGIDFAAYQKPETRLLVEGNYILTVAAMKKRKGYHFAIPVFAKLKEKYPDLKFVIVARKVNDNYSREINKLIKDFNLTENIVRLENLSEDELINLYKYAKVFFLPSVSSYSRDYFEGFGSVYLEAQSCGTPVVVSKGGGQEDALIDGKTGFSIEEGDINGYVRALLKFLDNETSRRQMSEAAKKFAQSMDWKENLKKYYERFQEIIS